MGKNGEIKFIRVYGPDGIHTLKINKDDYLRLRSQFGEIYDSGGYPMVVLRGKSFNNPVPLARVVLGFYDMKMVVDHINHDRYDCTRANLRIGSRQQNSWNRGKLPLGRPTVSRYIGVSPTSKNRWLAAITQSGKRIVIGRFATEEEAAIAYNNKAIELRGEWAVLNKIEDKIYKNKQIDNEENEKKGVTSPLDQKKRSRKKDIGKIITLTIPKDNFPPIDPSKLYKQITLEDLHH